MAAPLASTYTENILTQGKLAKDDIAQHAANGVAAVVNLQPLAEQEKQEHYFVEQAAVEQAGLQYFYLPVASAADITKENAEKLHDILEGLGDKKVLVHCASRNRAAALLAIRAVKLGAEPEAAIEQAKAAGLVQLEPRVRAVLAE